MRFFLAHQNKLQLSMKTTCNLLWWVWKYLSEVFVNKYRKVNFLNLYFTNVSLFSTLTSVWLKYLMCGQLKGMRLLKQNLCYFLYSSCVILWVETKKKKNWKGCRKARSAYTVQKEPVTTMLTYPWKCTVLHCNHLGNTWKPLVLMT